MGSNLQETSLRTGSTSSKTPASELVPSEVKRREV